MLYQFTYKGNKTILIHQYTNKKIRENSSLTNFKQKIILNIICIIFLCNHGIGFQICMKKFNLIKIVICHKFFEIAGIYMIHHLHFVTNPNIEKHFFVTNPNIKQDFFVINPNIER